MKTEEIVFAVFQLFLGEKKSFSVPFFGTGSRDQEGGNCPIDTVRALRFESETGRCLARCQQRAVDVNSQETLDRFNFHNPGF